MMQSSCANLLLGALLLGAAACGGSLPAAPIPAPAKLESGCKDWVHDDSDGVAWEVNGDADAIETFIGTVPNSDFFAFKGAGPVDAPIAKVANVLIDTSRQAEWVPHFGGMRVVRDVSEREKVIYRHVTTPFIIDDRDFVVKARISKEETSGHLRLDFSSTTDPDAPPIEGIVRGELHSSGYRMWPIDGGKRTMVIFTVHVDPMGDVPAWIVNLFQTGYARGTIENLRAQAAKPDVEEHPQIKAEFLDFKPACRRNVSPG